jgi:CRP-like cAMP-binding protein
MHHIFVAFACRKPEFHTIIRAPLVEGKTGDMMGRDPSDCALCATRLTCVTARMHPHDLATVQPTMRKRRLRRGDELATEGEVASTVRVIKVGSAFGYRRGMDGRTRPVGMAARGAALGLFGVFGQHTQVSVMAASETRVCEIPVSALAGVAARDDAFHRYIAGAAVQGCGQLAAWSEAMRLRGVTNQLAYTLLLLADAQRAQVVELPTHSALGELLGTSRETVARSLGVLEEDRAISRKPRKQCEIVREKLLARLERAGS